MLSENLSVIKVGNILLVTVPSDPDDETMAVLQDAVLNAMVRFNPAGLVLDISTVQVFDSYFARVIAETVQMVSLMGGRSVVAGMRASVAATATQLGLSLQGALTALDVDRAMQMLGGVNLGSEPS